MTRAKICGITRIEDAEHAARAGADYLGLNFWPRSKRYVATALAAELAAAARAARPDTAIVGLFVDPSIDDVLAAHSAVRFDVIQLHGDETADTVTTLTTLTALPVWKAHAVADASAIERLAAWPAAAHLLDAPSAARGGSGNTFDWSLGAQAVAAGHRIVLAGGLTADNVAAAITAVRPWAVDVASGVESAPGRKDPARVDAFLAAMRTVG